MVYCIAFILCTSFLVSKSKTGHSAFILTIDTMHVYSRKAQAAASLRPAHRSNDIMLGTMLVGKALAAWSHGYCRVGLKGLILEPL